MPVNTVTERFLLEGVFYAAEQAGLLLRDAFIAYTNKSYSTAIVLAAFAREEIGRSTILIRLRRKVVIKGEAVTLETVKTACKEHEEKQLASHISAVQRADPSTTKMFENLAAITPQSEEYKTTHAAVWKVLMRKRERAAGERHEARISALYVEPNQSGTGWDRPIDTLGEEAKIFLEDTRQEYLILFNILQFDDRFPPHEPGRIAYPAPGANVFPADLELDDALRKWEGRPKLLPPEGFLIKL
jgi:AbiV family abortive infection protein